MSENLNIKEIKSLNSYKEGFKTVRMFSLAIVALTIVGFGLSHYLGLKEIEKAQNQIYIIDNEGIAYTANMSEQSKEIKKIEYMNHVEMFIRLWYEYDEYTYDDHVEKGLNLLGETGKYMYEDLKNNNVKENLIRYNLVATANVDSISVNMNTDPATVYVLFEQTYRRKDNKKWRKMEATCKILDVGIKRSLNNPHGVKIEDWNMKTLEIK